MTQDLSTLSHAGKDELILSLVDRLEAALARIGELEKHLARFERPAKTPDHEPGSPFGQSIAALVVYLHYTHAIGMERLATLMDEIFSLTLSEGAISNMLARAREPLLVAAATIRATVLASPVVCSDETSARVSGKNWWEWVFIGTLAVLHVIRPSRGKAVVQALFGEIRPMVWVSDMLGSQRGHAVEWQVCLAHLLRDATYAIECGDTVFSAAFKRLLLRAIAIGDDVTS